MKKIVVPVDFSPYAEAALKAASDIARKSPESTIHLVHVYERPISGHSLQFQVDTSELKRFRDLVVREMQTLVEKDYLVGIPIKKHILADKAVWEFVNTGLLEDADLIVMGTREPRGWKALFQNSQAQQVVRHANCPVLVVKKSDESFHLHDVVFASNFYGEAEELFPRLLQVFQLFNATIHLLKVNTPGSFEPSLRSKQLMKDFAAKFELEDFTLNIFNDISIESGIRNFANEMEADLVALETHGRTGLDQFFLGSIAEDVMKHADCPVLSVRMLPEPTPPEIVLV